MSNLLTLATIAGLLAMPSASRAETTAVKADLSSAAETPPNESKARGWLNGSYDPASRKLTFGVTYTGLSGPATMAHFHAPASTGKAAGVEIPIQGSVESPIKGEMTLTEAQAKNLTDGMTYFNVHTAKNKAGEIRGQVMLGK